MAGFSYAQAARGTPPAASQASSSQTASGAVTPAKSVSLEASSGGNWADDVEESEGPRSVAPTKAGSSQADVPMPQDSAIERTKAEEKAANGVSGVSSPEITGSATSNASTTTREDSPSAPTGSSSDATWETKSQASEPAWIAERKERQNGSHASDGTAQPERERRGKKKDSTPKEPKEEPKAVVLQEALPPPVNPWQRRAEEAKSKAAMPLKSLPAPAYATPSQKENQAPTSTAQRKPHSATPTQRDPVSVTRQSSESEKASQPAARRPDEVRISHRQSTKQSSGETRPDSGSAKGGTVRSQTPPTATKALPPVKDETLWPTPDTAQDRERKESSAKQPDDKVDEDNTPASKRKKTEWKPVAVTPNVIWETTSMNESRERKGRAPGSERGGRGGARGRGSVRGGAAANGGDRHAGRASPTATNAELEPPSKAASSANDRGHLQNTPKQSASVASAPTGQALHAPTTQDASTQANATDVPPAYTRRARSPKKASPAQVPETDDVATPAPIPRKTPGGAQSVDSTLHPQSDPPVRMVPTDSRKESRSDDVFRDPQWKGTPRGGKRGGRGRGGNGIIHRGDFGHGHSYGNGFSSDPNGLPQYGVPASPSAYQRGNHHQFSYPPPGSTRGGWQRGGLRSHSIPIESFYPRFASQPFGTHHGQMPNVHGYIPGVSDFGPVPPMSAILPSPQEAQAQILMMLTAQLEYYFGVENLIRDIFLRQHMDSQGFVFLDFIAGFKRVMDMTLDRDLVKTACLNSETLELCTGEDGKDRVRKREGWQQFIRPVEERDASAQTEGPQRLQRAERPHLSMPAGPSHFQGPYSAGPLDRHARPHHRPYDSAMMNGFAPQFVPNGELHGPPYSSIPNGEETRGQAIKPPVYENGAGSADRTSTSADGPNVEPDAFPDDQTSALGVVVRMGEQKTPYHSAASRTFSNGSIDSRSIASELDKASEADGKQLSNGSPQVNGTEKLPNLTRHLSGNKARSPDKGITQSERQVCWAKDVNNIPEGTTYEPYADLRIKALDERKHAATGNCPYDLDVLYQFWCHFLCRNFNNKMYGEFQHFALEDAHERNSLTGVNNLLKFYAHSLNSPDPIRERIARDYVGLVKSEPPALEGAAFKQLRAAWRNGALNLKNRKKLSDVMDGQLKVALDKTES